ncbi:MAG TPA: UDP-N-acetylglucosamine diphosphorylase [Spirochaetaceae bacterium]|jgi:NDP-sugar pyrophosphorylase family protein|nr:UDP-N-acetylglucosamine diphosphorylase [Spirochaetaceae bacterium]
MEGKMSDFPRLWNIEESEFADLFAQLEAPWEALHSLDGYLASLLQKADVSGQVVLSPVPEGVHIEGLVYIAEGCVIESGAFIRGPAWIGAGCEIRSGCYIRGGVIAGSGAVLGHASEFKHCILLSHAQAPHFNYVGDSVLGIHAHIGAGVILSNYRLDGKPVPVRAMGAGERIETGLAKFGALIGDYCEIGCNTVLNPGTILGAQSVVLPLSNIRGTWPPGSRLPG